jgi:acyl carrier protein
MNMIMEQNIAIQARVLELLSKKIDAGRRIDLDSSVVEDTGLDSVSVMDFVMEIDHEFDITIPLDQVAEVRTVGDLAHAVEVILRKRVAAQGEPKKEGH